MSWRQIVLKNVRVHNLKGIDLTLQPRELVVFTGVSGSGKSSLAFDTLYVEGQRRYIESLPHASKRFVGELTKPEADRIEGISPTIAIEQKWASHNPRSTVGTLTSIYDYLRVLLARVGVPHCPISGEAVAAQSLEKILATCKALPEGKEVTFTAPYVRGKKGSCKDELAELGRKGFLRLYVDGKWAEGDLVELSADLPHDIDAVIDRFKTGKENHSRMAEAVTAALDLGKGVFRLFVGKEEKLFSQHAYSQKSGQSYGPLDPQDFSFNHPRGMCPNCSGLSIASAFDLSKIIDENLSISEDCCKIASSYNTVRYGNIYRNLGIDLKKPWKSLPEESKQIFLYGTSKKWTRMTFTHPEKKSRWIEFVRWQGVLHEAKERLIAAKSDLYRSKMQELMIQSVCPICQGSRLKPYPSASQLGGKKLQELTAMPLEDLKSFFNELTLPPLESQIAEEPLREIKERLFFLIQIGLGYLNLDRSTVSLSGGEAQRLRLASQLGLSLVGATYVLDEPSIGLHAIDHHRLIEALKRLRDLGNTILVVEHDADMMRAADTIVDVGPGAGALGGQIVAQGSFEALLASPESITGGYLSGRLAIEQPKKRRRPTKEKVTIVDAHHHNLKNVTLSIPLGLFVCVTGVSGSGKSSLIEEVLYPALARHLHDSKLPIGAHKEIRGLTFLDKIISVDQSPIGRTPRSNAATYIKLFDHIRDLYRELPESRVRGLTASHFSFNVEEGSCSYCRGLGEVKLDMDFMQDAFTPCPQCKGKRFDPEVLAVNYKGHTIFDILNLSVKEAKELFQAIPPIYKKLETLSQVGLDYLTLGQPSTTLSGGEAQRIKLAKELVRPSTGKTLYLFDEPSTGLHFHDLSRLLAILQTLVKGGNTVLVIEHNLDVIQRADWIIDIGPGAGALGGQIVGEGTPEEIAKLDTPTGQVLRGLSAKTKEKKRIQPIETIQIEEATQNHLKNLSLSIPHGKITVFSGPSGSGKSSLAFETLYAEGQRRYVETLPSYFRQSIPQMPRPKVGKISGLPPTLALEQKTGGLNPRSTVGTLTEIYDHLRLLFAHLGVPHCPETGEVIRSISKETVVKRLLEQFEGQPVLLLSPLTVEKKEPFPELLERLSRLGFLRIRLNGTLYEIDEPIPYDPSRPNALFLVIDRLTPSKREEARLFESIEKATEISEGKVVVATPKADLLFNLAFAVESTGKAYPPITPQTFSFNSPEGMCLECQGLGSIYGASLLEPDVDVGELFKEKGTSLAFRLLDKLKLSQEALWNGSLKTVEVGGLTCRWRGLNPFFTEMAKMAKRDIKEALLPLLRLTPCPSCKGCRISPLARHVTIERLSLPDLTALTLEEAYAFLKPLKVPSFLEELKAEMISSLSFLIQIGLNYLSLDRSVPTLSGGELQRVRIIRQLGAHLTSCLYVLDEPTIGLHPSQSHLLLRALLQLKDLGNTLLIVEHDLEMIRHADYLVDFGPKSGRYGGEITAQGSPAQVAKDPNSLTGAYLSGKKKIPLPKKRFQATDFLHVEKATLHNLKNLSAKIPIGALTCLTGVSGSGKSTLLRDLIEPAAQIALKSGQETVNFLGARFINFHLFDQILSLDQNPIGQTIRSDISTYSDIHPQLRILYASLPAARAKGLQPRHFSPNHKQGMCRTCLGLGFRKIDLQFLPAVEVTCEGCHGYRLNPRALEVQYKGKHLGQILELPVSEALPFFDALPRIKKRLQLLTDIGLSYLTLGQEIATLSGGEGQRLRLLRELAKKRSGSTLYLIDEPSTGLHSEDLLPLIQIFHRLRDQGNTLLIIEHNLDLIGQADHLIDLGPGAGPLGGTLVAQGTPEEVAKSKRSLLAPYL